MLLHEPEDKNLIVILGNGFDLAHGLKTSYTDFADYYFEVIFQKTITFIHSLGNKNKSFFKPFFVEKMKSFFSSSSIPTDPFIKYFVDAYRFKQYDELKKHLYKNPNTIKNFISNNFLGNLYANNYINWFDIENAYFRELIEIKKNTSKYDNDYIRKGLNELNTEFEFIRSELVKYLKTIEYKRKEKVSNFFKTHFKYSHNIYIINFNYTNTIEQYLDVIGKEMIKVNYIHGNLEDEDVIFGYGNDQNEDYQNMKNTEIDEFLEHFKTFEYLRCSNYQAIFQDALDVYKNYDVIVLGHSLGTTDKTLLDSIINSEKCEKIHLFKRLDYKDNEDKLYRSYRTLNFAASRVINNEKELRKKVINYGASNFFPSED